jgi:hypothetical protein
MSISQKKKPTPSTSSAQANYAPVLKAQQAVVKANYSLASVRKMERAWEAYKKV